MLAHLTAFPALADRALSWLAAHLDGFQPFQGKDWPEGFRQKALLELAMLCMWLRDKPVFRDRRVADFLRFVSCIHANPLFRERLVRVDNTFVQHVATLVALDICAVPVDDHFRSAIQDLLDHSNVLCTERTSHGMLELRYVLDRGGFRHELPSYEALYESGILSKPLNLLYMSEHDAYTITHALFFLTDFGARPVPGITASRFKDVRSTVEYLLGSYIHRGNWDLVGEFLLSFLCLQFTESPLYRLGLRALVEVQWPDGTVPGPYYDPEKCAGMDELNRRHYILKSVIILRSWPHLSDRCAKPVESAMQDRSIEARATEAFARSRQWLLKVADTQRGIATLTGVMQVLTGVWLCECATETAPPSLEFRSLVARVADRLASEDEAGRFDPLSYDPNLLLLCYGFLVRHGHWNRRINTFAEELAHAFMRMPTIPLRHAVVATLLSRLGYGPCPPPQLFELPDTCAGALPLLQAGTDGIMAVCGNVAAATCFGTAELRASSEVRDVLALTLPVIMLTSFRTYDLEIGSLVLRTLGYIGTPETPLIRSSRQFLLMQQQRDGRFGYLAKERTAFLEAESVTSAVVEERLDVPISVSCIWALAEAVGANLFSSVGELSAGSTPWECPRPASDL